MYVCIIKYVHRRIISQSVKHARKHTHAHTHTHTHTHVPCHTQHTYTCTCTYTFTRTYTHMHIIYTCTHIHFTRTYTHTHTRTYTYKHTCAYGNVTFSPSSSGTLEWICTHDFCATKMTQNVRLSTLHVCHGPDKAGPRECRKKKEFEILKIFFDDYIQEQWEFVFTCRTCMRDARAVFSAWHADGFLQVPPTDKRTASMYALR